MSQDGFALSLGETTPAHMRGYLRPDSVPQERLEPLSLSGLEPMGHEPLFAFHQSPTNGLGLALISEHRHVGSQPLYGRVFDIQGHGVCLP